MKKELLLMFCCLIVTTCFITTQAYGIGISPGRRTYDITENGGLDANITYWLDPPQGQYATFSILNPMGLNTTITGFSPTAGVEYREDGSVLIDWDAAGRPSVISAFVHVSSPDNWQCPIDPGYASMNDLVWYSEGFGSVTMAVISQIVLKRNYALKVNVTGLQESYQANCPVQFGLEVTDYTNYAWYLNFNKITWSIDWESDGNVDESQSGIQMIGELGETEPDRLYAGFQYLNLDFDHTYSDPGSYLVTINLTDRMETTTLQIPIEVTPEPATLSIVALSLLVLTKRKHTR